MLVSEHLLRFDKCIHFCNSSLYLDTEHIHHSRMFSYAPSQSTLTPTQWQLLRPSLGILGAKAKGKKFNSWFFSQNFKAGENHCKKTKSRYIKTQNILFKILFVQKTIYNFYFPGSNGNKPINKISNVTTCRRCYFKAKE